MILPTTVKSKREGVCALILFSCVILFVVICIGVGVLLLFLDERDCTVKLKTQHFSTTSAANLCKHVWRMGYGDLFGTEH